MKLEAATIQPRSRRRPAQRGERLVCTPVEDSRTRILIRLPWLGAAAEAKAASAPASKPASPMPVAETAAKVSAVSTPAPAAAAPREPSTASAATSHVAPPPPIPRSTYRMDAAHPAVAAPHTASPAWSRPQGRMAMLKRQPLVWTAAVVSMVVVVVFLVRSGGNNSAAKSAPTESSVKAKKRVNSAEGTADKQAGDDRVARRQQGPASSKARKADRADGPALNAAATMPNQSTAGMEFPPLDRRAGMNSPASLEPWHATPAQGAAQQSFGAQGAFNSQPPNRPVDPFSGQQRSGPMLTPEPAMRSAPPSASGSPAPGPEVFEDADARSARFQGTIQPTKLR